MKSIFTEKAPSVVGPYSQAIVANGFVFCAGQIGVNPKTGEVAPSIEEQTTQVMENLKAVIEASGSDISHVVKTTIYLTNMGDYAKVNEIYGKYFPEVKPARATIGVKNLPREVLVEIDAVAVTS